MVWDLVLNPFLTASSTSDMGFGTEIFCIVSVTCDMSSSTEISFSDPRVHLVRVPHGPTLKSLSHSF